MREIFADIAILKCSLYLTLTFEIKVIAIIGNFKLLSSTHNNQLLCQI